MTACKDTLLAGRMGRSPAEMSLADLLQERLRAAGRDEAAIAPVEFRPKDIPPAAGGPGQASTEPQVEMRLSTAAQGLVDQAAVALLRPLLKQWLDANMQYVLERALHVEAESAKNGQQ
jgi:cell pole-organizing protein PopZ